MNELNQSLPDRLFLVGLMGAGKTTIGKRLAQRLDWVFVDSDAVIEERTGVSIPTIFELEGEASFRKRESAVIDELTQRTGIVLATGGGAVINPHNRECLHTRGWCVYLSAPAPDLYRRVRNDRNRPLLQNDDPYLKLSELLTQREPWYRSTAHHEESTAKHSLSAVTNRILQCGGWPVAHTNDDPK